MTSAKKKGDMAELEVAAIFESWGYKVCRSPRTMKRVWTPRGVIWVSQSNDFFGLFDGIAVKGKQFIWYQVKSQPTDAYDIRNEIGEWETKHLFEGSMCQIWVRRKNKNRICYVVMEQMKKNKWLYSYYSKDGKEIPKIKMKGDE